MITADSPADQPMIIPALGEQHRAELGGLIRPGWRRDALCAGRVDLDWYSDDLGEQRAAFSVCRECPVRLSCLAAGMLGDEYGIWGGLTETDRDQLRVDLTYGVAS